MSVRYGRDADGLFSLAAAVGWPFPIYWYRTVRFMFELDLCCDQRYTYYRYGWVKEWKRILM